MKRLLALCVLLGAAFGCFSQVPFVFIDDLVVGDYLLFTNNLGATVGFKMFGNYILQYTNSQGPGHIDFDRNGIIFADGFRAAGTGTGAFEGDGSGLTNIFGTNIVGAVFESSHATNADIAVSASNATNFWGSVSPTNLPSWVAYTTSNQTFTALNTFTNLNIQGNQTNGVGWRMWNSAGTHYMTNNANGFGIDGGPTSGFLLFIHGSMKLDGTGYRTANNALFGDGTVTLNNPAMWKNQTAGASSVMDWTFGTNDTNRMELTALGLLTIQGSLLVTNSVTATNGLYYSATSNGVVSTNVIQPLHTFAALMGFVTNTINGGANTYAIVTNYSTARTNLMSCSLTAGTITNTIAGYYYCAIHMSMVALDAGALVEGDLLLNGAVRDEISFQTQFDPGTPRYKGASAFGILYIPANSQITFQIKSSGASGIELRRQQLVVMPP